MKIVSEQISLRNLFRASSPLAALRDGVLAAVGKKCEPLRLAVVSSSGSNQIIEAEGIYGHSQEQFPFESIFSFRRRDDARTHQFNSVMLIPTGVDCAIGGHAGDATPAARLLASACDNLVVHPNVVNASDINEQAHNCLYVEGSLICRMLMGTIGLRKSRMNRVLLVTEDRPECQYIVDQTINCAEGARATLGMDISQVLVLKEGLLMKTGYSKSGRVTGVVERLEHLVDLLREKRDSFDAVALSTKITPHIDSVQLHKEYFGEGGANPWGAVEAILTHFISSVMDVPSAHAPTMSNEALFTTAFGVVEPRKAAEIISTTFLFCVLKGLHQAPRIVVNPPTSYDPSLMTVEDISCLVIPDGCVGLPTLAALEQGIPVIAVRNNTNLMKNDLRRLPFAHGQLIYAQNYYEAAGIMQALRVGVSAGALQRPMKPLHIERTAFTESLEALEAAEEVVVPLEGGRSKRSKPRRRGGSDRGGVRRARA